MCTTVNLDKVFNVSSDQPVFFLRFCTKRAHNRKCRQNLYENSITNVLACEQGLRLRDIVKCRPYTKARKARERGSPSRLRRSSAFSHDSPSTAKWYRDLLAR